MVKKAFGGILSISLSVVTFVTPMFDTKLTYAAPQLREMTKTENQDGSNDTPMPKTMRERILEIQNSEAKKDMEVSNILKGRAYVPKGVELKVELVNELSSKKNKTHETVKLKLVEDLIINDVVVVPAGTDVYGHITKSKGSGLFGRAGTLEFSVDEVRTINNVTIPLEYVGRIQAGSDGGAVVVAAVVSLVGGLFMKGANVKIPAGTQVIARVKNNTDLNTTLDGLKEAMTPGKPHGVSITLK